MADSPPASKSDPNPTTTGSISPSSFDSPAEAFPVEEFCSLDLADSPNSKNPEPVDQSVNGGQVEVEKKVLVVVVVDSEEKGGSGFGGGVVTGKVRFPRRAGEPDCSYYVRFGTCRFGMKCKFNHPIRKKKISSAISSKEKGNSSCSNSSRSSPESGQTLQEDSKETISAIHVEAKDTKSEDKGTEDSPESINQTNCEAVEEKRKEMIEQEKPKVMKEIEKGALKKARETYHNASKEKEKGISWEVDVQDECKYYSMPGGCKFGNSCKYIHREEKTGKSEADPVELNFVGLPLRPGEMECSYYMRNGSCKYSTNCKFHHPDPTAVGSRVRVSENQNGNTKQQAASGPSQHIPSWPEQRTLRETVPPVPFMAPAPSYNAGIIPPPSIYPNPQWNGYQVPVNPYYPPGYPILHFPAPAVSHAMYKLPDIPGHQIQQANIDEYPERPGEPECQHFVKSGFCKFRMKCKYHHPKARVSSASTGGALSPLGLPLKPDQPVCTQYGQFGVCKYGPACMYHHPFNYGSPMPAAASWATAAWPISDTGQ